MKSHTIFHILTGLVLLSLALAACGGPSSPAPATEVAAVTPAPTTQVVAASPSPGGAETEALQITFTAEPQQIAPGKCATLRWEVTGPHFVVMLDDEQVADQGSKEVCPPETQIYFLRVDTGETMEERQVTVQVGAGAPPAPSGEDEIPPGEAYMPEGGETTPSAASGIPPYDQLPVIGVPPGPATPPFAYDIPYLTVDGETLTLNVYRPAGEATYPVLLYIHGGGFNSGNKWEGQHWASYLLPWGYAVVSIDYRLAPQHPFPAAIADVQCAIAWVRQHADEYHLDAQHMALIGSSAGGHLAALAGMAGAPGAPIATWQPSCGAGDNFQVQAVVSHSGPMDLQKILSTGEGHDAVVGFIGSACQPATACTQASPITYVSQSAPPVLLFHGSNDGIVPVVNARDMEAALKAAGVPVTYVEMQNEQHVYPLTQGNLQTLRQFLDQYLKP